MKAGSGVQRLTTGLFGIVLALVFSGGAVAQGPAPAAKGNVAAGASKKVSIDVLKGAWVRPDGGYTILIKDISPTGQLEATYFNPKPLPFAKAQASPGDGNTLRVFLELRAGGYDGSTYELTYDPATDRLAGTYFQAVMKQKFDVVFARK
jgi:hypothetical protein